MARRLQFGIEDEDAFEAAKRELLAGFEASVDGPKDGDTFVAGCMLQYQWTYEDGRLAHWTTGRLGGLLLTWFPAKVTLSAADIRLVTRQVADFLGHLDSIGVLTGDPLARLVEFTTRSDKEFRAAMQDRSRFDIAKRMISSMDAEGLDPTDAGAIDAWMRDFNARPLAERDAILGAVPDDDVGDDPDDDADDPYWDGDHDAPMPPVRLAPAEELEEAARQSVILTRITAFARYVDKPRKLTNAGNLTLADGKALAGLLGIDEQWDPTYGGSKTYRTTSSGHVRSLTRTFWWARGAGLVKVRHGWVSCTARGRKLGASPRDDWSMAYRALLEGKVVDRTDEPWWWEQELLDEFSPELVPALYRADGLPLDDLHDAAVSWLEGTFVLPAPGQPYDLRGSVPSAFDRALVEPLVQLGAAAITDGLLALTPLGVWDTNRWLRSRGVDAPVLEDLPKLDVRAFLTACASLELADAETEMDRWIEARPGTAASELAAAARDGDLRILALHALERAGSEGADAVRGLLEVPDVRPMAILWLVRYGHMPQASLSSEDLQSAFIETVAMDLDHGGEDEMAEHLDSLGPREEQLRFVEALLRAPHPRTTDVLLALGRAHPDKVVAKTARTIAFKRQGIRPH